MVFKWSATLYLSLSLCGKMHKKQYKYRIHIWVHGFWHCVNNKHIPVAQNRMLCHCHMVQNDGIFIFALVVIIVIVKKTSFRYWHWSTSYNCYCLLLDCCTICTHAHMLICLPTFHITSGKFNKNQCDEKALN